jgi:lipopolysaccharide biosynthesis glycosyltransferase
MPNSAEPFRPASRTPPAVEPHAPVVYDCPDGSGPTELPPPSPVQLSPLTPIDFQAERQADAAIDSIPVVCALDDGYAMPMATMVCSLLDHLNPQCKLQLYVIDGGIQPGSKAKILASVNADRCTITWLQPDRAMLDRMSQFKTSGHLSLSTYYRLFLPELLPIALEKVIYLDCDLIVLADLLPLWQLDIAPYYLLAAQDSGIIQVGSDSGLLNYQALGIPAEGKYFNAGVLVLNLARWRAVHMGWQIIEYMEKNPEFIRLHDQDALNATLFDKWGELDPRWNQTPHLYRNFRSWQDSPFSEAVYSRTLSEPYIVHFASSAKPWNRYTHRNHRQFYGYLDQTAWAGWRFPLWKDLWQRAGRAINKLRLIVGSK